MNVFNDWMFGATESSDCNVSPGFWPDRNSGQDWGRRGMLVDWMTHVIGDQRLPGIGVNRIAVYNKVDQMLTVTICWVGKGFNEIMRYSLSAYLPSLRSKTFAGTTTTKTKTTSRSSDTCGDVLLVLSSWLIRCTGAIPH